MASPILELLSATLSPDVNNRISAELKLAESFSSPDTGVALSQLILAQDMDMSLRQSASVVLRKYVRERWSPIFPTFKGFPPSIELKSQIRQAVFLGLSDSNRKIRSLCAHTLSSIAHADWPDEYPELLSLLLGLLSSNSSDSVHGAMQVFTEFVKSDLSEDHMLPVLRELLPVLLSILGSTGTHSPLTRARTISVFRQSVTALFMVKDQHPQETKEAIASVLPVWLDAFKVLLTVDLNEDVMKEENWDSLSVRIQLFKTLDTIHSSFPGALNPYIEVFLTASVAHLHALRSTFAHYYLSASQPVPSSSEDDTIELTQLLCPILDFMAAVIRGHKAKAWLDGGNLERLISEVLNFAQMTDDDEKTWAENANVFVAQEDDETQSYSVRVAGFDLLGSLMDKAPAQTVKAFHFSLQGILSTSKAAREAGKIRWWKTLEAALAAIGSQSEDVIDYIDNEQESGGQNHIDIDSLLTGVIPSILNLSEFQFLQGRGFVFASQYAKLLPLNLAGQYIEAASQVMESADAGAPIKVSAIKAIHNFSQGAEESALVGFAPRITKDLAPFLSLTSDDSLTLVLETLSVVLGIDKGSWLNSDLTNSLILALFNVWEQNSKDPIFLSILSEIFTTLASSNATGLYEAVVRQALPPLVNVIGTANPTEFWISSSAIELVSSLIRGAPTSGIGENVFALLAPNLFGCLTKVEDRDTIQRGLECLTQIVRKDCEQLVSWRDPHGRTGLEYVLSLIGKQLENADESGGLAMGDLIIHLFRKTGEAVLPVLPQLLQAMTNRMLTAKTATFTQSLIIPFAFLVYNQRATVLSLLESINVQGRSGLDIVVNTWCENADTIQGFWPSRVSTLALVQLMASGHPGLRGFMVKGDIIVSKENKDVIMTRSRTKTTPHQFTSIPFPVKALKILIGNIQCGGEAAAINARAPGAIPDIDSDDGDEDWAEEEGLKSELKKDDFGFLSGMIGPRGMAFDNDDILDDDDDEDLKNDAVSTIDMQEHLVSFIREYAKNNTDNFTELVNQLTAEEMLVIRNIVGE